MQGERARKIDFLRAEQELDRHALIFRESMEEFPGPVAIFDHDDRLIAYNAEYRALHRTAFNVLEAEHREEIFYADLVTISRHELVAPEECDAYLQARVAMHRKADGKPFDQFYPGHGWIRYKKVRTPSGAIAVFGTDVTELLEKTRELEGAMHAACAANKAKSDFLANMSHELRTPLNAILGFAEALQMPSIGNLKPGPQTEYVGHIHEAGQHLLSVISQILDIAKIEAQRMDMNRSACCLYDISNDCVSMMEVEANEKGVSIEIVENTDNTVIYGDSQRLKQVILNILSNAVKFSRDNGDIILRIDGGDDYLTLVVQDCGIGIPADMIETVFKPFAQVENAYARSVEGTGLGLPIARALVEAHNGQLSLTSSEGKGTCVSIELPRH